MIHPKQLYDLLNNNGLNFYCGVPDSTLKDFCAYITDNSPKEKNITTANEGNAIALATGYHFATGKYGVMFMQNSGLGNTINPLTSLTDPEVYSVPLLMIIGWRGYPGKKDEPQHIKKGMITLGLLNTLGIPYAILPETKEETEKVIQKAVQYMHKNNAPYALVVKKGLFEKYQLQNKHDTHFAFSREDAIKFITPFLDENDIVVSTTGKTSRELFEFRASSNAGHQRDFLTVGSMGHASSIGLGIALQKPSRNVYCFDGDGAFIMHMGALSSIGKLQPSNFKHIVFNNYAHDSVGGQPTAADIIDIPTIAKANGYKAAFSAETEDEIREKMKEMNKVNLKNALLISLDVQKL